jgi:uncharacterized protein YpiB (UPF0302 family)
MERSLLPTSQQPEIEILNSLYAKIVLKKALLDFRINQILKEIDQTLQVRDKEKFLRLTKELMIIS